MELYYISEDNEKPNRKTQFFSTFQQAEDAYVLFFNGIKATIEKFGWIEDIEDID